MELEKIRNLSDEELVSTQTTAAEQLFRLRFQKSLGKPGRRQEASWLEARHRPLEDDCA